MEAGSTAVVAGPHAGARAGLAMPLQRSLWVIICKLVISTVDMRHYNDKLQAGTTLTLKVTSWQCVCIRASDRKLCENTEVILQQRRILNGNTSEEPSGVFPEQKTQSVALQKIGFHPRQGRDRQKERRLQNQRLEQTGAGTRQSEHLGGKAPRTLTPKTTGVPFIIYTQNN